MNKTFLKILVSIALGILFGNIFGFIFPKALDEYGNYGYCLENALIAGTFVISIAILIFFLPQIFKKG